jgi:hypothetical protein
VLLEVVGVLGAGQFLLRSLLFADDREKTFSGMKWVAAAAARPVDVVAQRL